MDAIAADVEEMDAIIGQFLDFARGDDEEKQENDLRGVLEELAEHYTRLSKKITVEEKPIPPFRFALRSRTQGRGSFTMHFSHYAEAPASIAEEVIAKATGKVAK